jgi:hypothetical protein
MSESFEEQKVGYDDLLDYKRFMRKTLEIARKFKCNEYIYKSLARYCFAIEEEMEENLGE